MGRVASSAMVAWTGRSHALCGLPGAHLLRSEAGTSVTNRLVAMSTGVPSIPTMVTTGDHRSPRSTASAWCVHNIGVVPDGVQLPHWLIPH